MANSDFPTNQTFHQFHNLAIDFDLHRIMRGFHGAFATGVACQQGTLALPDTWFCPPFWDLLMLQLLRPNSSNLPCPYSTFHLEYPLVLSQFCYILDWLGRETLEHRRSCARLSLFHGIVYGHIPLPEYIVQPTRLTRSAHPLLFRQKSPLPKIFTNIYFSSSSCPIEPIITARSGVS